MKYHSSKKNWSQLPWYLNSDAIADRALAHIRFLDRGKARHMLGTSNYTSSSGVFHIFSINELPLRTPSTHTIIDKGVLDFFPGATVLYFLLRRAVKNMKLKKESMRCEAIVVVV